MSECDNTSVHCPLTMIRKQIDTQKIQCQTNTETLSDGSLYIYTYLDIFRYIYAVFRALSFNFQFPTLMY